MNDSIQYLGKMLDVCATRQRVLANNLANSNTPGYVRKDVSFKDTLADAVKSDDSEVLAAYQPEIVEDRTSAFKADGNNVSSQKELSAISENNILYMLATRAIGGKFQTLHKVISSR